MKSKSEATFTEMAFLAMCAAIGSILSLMVFRN
jgi:hypothetical protein